MTSLRFVGDLPLWLGLSLALLVAVMAWRYYRRESFDLPHRLRWMLPSLRSLAFFLGIMVLTGPVLHHRQTIGELGQVKIYVDSSRSMALLDRHVSPGRKLLIAEQQGWIADGRVNSELLDQATDLADVRAKTMTGLLKEGLSAADVLSLRDKLLAIVEPAIVSFNGMPIGMRTNGQANTNSPTEPDSLIADLKAIAATDVPTTATAVNQLTTACKALQSIEQQLLTAFNADVQQLVDSGDDSIQAALAMFDETPRWRRAERSLLETEGALFAELKQHHNVEVLALQDHQAIELLDGIAAEETPDQLSESPEASTTDLASGIAETQKSVATSESTAEQDSPREVAKPNTAIVLLTDGQHNSGPSPIQTARVLGGQGISFFPVSLGAT
ncbi:MAG: VWA domain-containing protein, partial [Fuerstiella sp.]|nr:VWA domain-containing protein [Fuerstiella sp.]